MTTASVIRRPLVPEDRGRSVRPGKWFGRAIFAQAAAVAFPGSDTVRDIAKRRWDDDSRIVETITRSAVDPASTTGSGWADTVAAAVGDYVALLAPVSAGAKLIGAAPRVSLVARKTISFPARDAALAASTSAWTAEGGPAPVMRFDLNKNAVLGPTKKLVSLTVVTRELFETTNAEATFTTLVDENIACGLDAKLFSDDAVSDAAPAGILDGIDPQTASTSGGETAMRSDLELLAAEISGAASGLTFIGNPKQINAVRLRIGTLLPPEIQLWGSIAVPDGRLICLDAAAFCSGFSPLPQFSASRETALVMQDTDPAPVAETGTPNVVAAPLRSLFQTDCVAVKVTLRAAWCLRAVGCVAWMSGCDWGPVAA